MISLSDADSFALQTPPSLSCDSRVQPLSRRLAQSWPVAAGVCLATWAIMRYVCFVGYEGSDDLFYARFAALWNRPPINHWEARLLANSLMRLAMLALGVSEWAAALPSILASLVVLICTLFACRRLGHIGHGWWAGLLVAVVPIDVRNATTVSAHGVMVGLMAAGTTAFLFADECRKARWIAAACLPLGVVAHYNGAYYVAALLLAGLMVAPRRYARAVFSVIVAGVMIMLGEMLVFRFAYGHMLLGLQLSSPERLKMTGDLIESGLTLSMVAWSLQQFIAGSPFGIALLVTAVGTARCYRRLSIPLRVLALAALIFWLVLSFGSYVPWDYRPFWRNARYLHPLLLPVAVLFAAVMVQPACRLRAHVAGVACLASCILMISLTGSWGQNAAISRELLQHALRHPEQRFVTDVHTANEMYVLNGMRTPANVAGTTDFGRSHYLDKTIRLVPEISPSTCSAVLVNPLNVQRTPTFAALAGPWLGSLEYETPVRYRTLCEWIPPLRKAGWAVRKPSASVHRLEPRGPAKTQTAG